MEKNVFWGCSKKQKKIAEFSFLQLKFFGNFSRLRRAFFVKMRVFTPPWDSIRQQQDFDPKNAG